MAQVFASTWLKYSLTFTLIIQSLDLNSPLYNHGIRAGDILVKTNDIKVKKNNAGLLFGDNFDRSKPSTVKFLIKHNGELKEFTETSILHKANKYNTIIEK